MRRASKRIKNDTAAAIRALERCENPRVLKVILARLNESAAKAHSADDLLHFRLAASIAERRLAELRS